VFFADQAKVFERLSVAWLGRVLDGWGLPPWLRHGVMGLVQGRAVCASVGGRLGPRHELLRSVGMGGTCSCLCWNVAYDPIIEGLSDTLRVAAPTYVDDTAAETRGERRPRPQACC